MMGPRLALSSFLMCLLLALVHCKHWVHHTVLDGEGRYHLYWTPPENKNGDSEITFKVEVRTKGYVGFGLSPNGGMAGSDIITAWIKNGRVYFQDRHGVGNRMPIKDDSQDWTLIEGYEQNWKLIESHENDTFTVFTFSRKLDTCDDKDMVIDESTMRVIYAYSDRDPVSENPFYHSKNRGSKSIMLLQDEVKKNLDPDFSSLLRWDVVSPDIDISSERTLYWCKIHKSPPISKKHHIVYVKPLIQKGHEQFVHHMLLYECVGGTPEEFDELLDQRGHTCYHPNMPDGMNRCQGVSLVWAVGGEDVVFPEHVGFPLEPEPGTYYMLEIHYDNPQLQSGIVDHSGMSIYYTPDLREFDAGCLMLGSSISPTVFVPPGRKEYVVVGHSSPECLAPVFPEEGIKALGVLLHSHPLGRKIKARHFRGNKELVPLAEEKNYDFNYQEYRYFQEEVNILPNDQITVECTYDSSRKERVTFGGFSTHEEMCLAFVLYYPRVKRFGSLSEATMHNIQKALNKNFTSLHSFYSELLTYDWASADVEAIEHVMRNYEHTSNCFLGNGQIDEGSETVSYPSDLEPFATESTCHVS